MYDCIEIWGIWPVEHLKLVVPIKPLLDLSCYVAGGIILLEEATAVREHGFLERVHMICKNT